MKKLLFIFLLASCTPQKQAVETPIKIGSDWWSNGYTASNIRPHITTSYKNSLGVWVEKAWTEAEVDSAYRYSPEKQAKCKHEWPGYTPTTDTIFAFCECSLCQYYCKCKDSDASILLKMAEYDSLFMKCQESGFIFDYNPYVRVMYPKKDGQ